MKYRKTNRLSLCCSGALLILLVLALLGCSDDVKQKQDAAVKDSGGGTDGVVVKDSAQSDSTLWPCNNPGQACNAHDPCAINPICGQDKRCRPQSYQDCSDNLDCTTDSCAGLGLCKNEPKKDSCALMVATGTSSVQKCLKKGDINPADVCKMCDPSVSQTKWSPRDGGVCDDKTSCTKDDKCVGGVCKGTYYGNQCSDALECTTDDCDGKGGCSNKLKLDWCKVGKECVKHGVGNADNCSYCDSKKNPLMWTVKTNVCKIGPKCQDKGATDITGCGVCDPATSATAWTPAPFKCLIQGSCYSANEKDSSGCGVCDPAKSKIYFTPVAGKCLIRGACYGDTIKSASGCGVCTSTKDASWWSPVSGASSSVTGFESGLMGYVLSAKAGGVGWQISFKRFHGGKSSLYYGDLTKLTYDNGKTNSGTATSPSIWLSSGQKAALHFWMYMDTETSAQFDVLTISANNTKVWTKGATTQPLDFYKRWIPVEVDLSAFAGKYVTLEFLFETKDAWSNSSEGIYIDDLTVITKCGKK